MRTRTLAVAAAGSATVLVATGITYASDAGSAPASPSVQWAARSVQPATPAAATSGGGSASGEKDEGRDRKGGGRASGEKDEGRDREGGGRGYGHKEEGRIYFNERTYSASTEGCITAASGLGASSFSVFNDSRKTVEVFRGFNCDNGAPVATVSPHGETNGVVTRTVHGGVFGDEGVVGSFRVIGDYDEW
ncbi:hypothetical protein [Kitasatospora sp. GP82]|uniref:hypothetical protein n=1 Tax=Kitasatospora sp. GP82 TaxID=3035089 RepID=UPI0024730783|nr:hypothetical protein [Kitasatospora sp. GP82]MDH6124627.1 hypothetical protein [Kitasatospora sp. GP82]